MLALLDPVDKTTDVSFQVVVLEQFPSCRWKRRSVDDLDEGCLATDGYGIAVELLVAQRGRQRDGQQFALSRKNFAFSASCRFSPAHKYRHRWDEKVDPITDGVKLPMINAL